MNCLHTIKQTGIKYLHQERYTHRAWMAKYGCSLRVVAVVWGFIQNSSKKDLLATPRYLLWLLYWLKIHPTWDEFSSTIQVSIKTARQKVYLTLAICYDILTTTSIVSIYV